MIKFLTLWQTICPAITLRPLLWEPLCFSCYEHSYNMKNHIRIVLGFFPTATVKCQTAHFFFSNQSNDKFKNPTHFLSVTSLLFLLRKTSDTQTTDQWHQWLQTNEMLYFTACCYTYSIDAKVSMKTWFNRSEQSLHFRGCKIKLLN